MNEWKSQLDRIRARRNQPVTLVSFDIKGIALTVQYMRRQLEERGIPVDVVVFRRPEGPIDSEAIKRAGFALGSVASSIVGLSLMTEDIEYARPFIEGIRENDPECVIIVGGVHASSVPMETKESLDVDAVIVGDGVESIAEVLDITTQVRPTNWVCGNHSWQFRQIGKILPSSKILSPHKLKLIDMHGIRNVGVSEHGQWHHWNKDHYHTLISIGCPYRCTYCANLHHRSPIHMDVMSIEGELTNVFHQYPQLNSVIFHDDAFHDGDTRRLAELCEMLQAVVRGGYIARLMPRFVEGASLPIMARSGLKLVKMGLQGSDRLNREFYGRPETQRSFLKAVHLLREYGIRIEVDLIISNPKESVADLIEMAQTLNEMPRPFKVHVYDLTFYPGTRIANRFKNQSSHHIDPSSSSFRTNDVFRKLLEIIPCLSKAEATSLIHPSDSYVRSRIVDRYSTLMKTHEEEWISSQHTVLKP